MSEEGITGPDGRRISDELVDVMARLAAMDAEAVAALAAAGMPEELIALLPDSVVGILGTSVAKNWRYDPAKDTYDRLVAMAESTEMSFREAGRKGGERMRDEPPGGSPDSRE
jgi:hypothetical protein